MNVTTYDGRAFLNVSNEKYDVIMVDAYQDITIPFQMSSVEFFKLVKNHLTDDGVMVVNMNMHGNGRGSINQYLADTISRVFDEVYTADVDNSTNRELFASNMNIKDRFKTNLKSEQNEPLSNIMIRVNRELIEYKPGNKILTDDMAPVEVLGMKTMDTLIKEEVKEYREVYKREGIKGLLK